MQRPFSGISRVLMGTGEMTYPHVKVQDAMVWVQLWGHHSCGYNVCAPGNRARWLYCVLGQTGH